MVTSGKDRLEVPLTAALPAPNIQFEPFANLGLIVLEQSGKKHLPRAPTLTCAYPAHPLSPSTAKTASRLILSRVYVYICLTVSSATAVFPGAKEVQFRNVGNKEGTFSIDYDHELPVKIRPLRHTLAPGQVVNVQVDVEGRELGPIRSVVPRVLCREPSLRVWWADARGVPCRALATVEVDQQPPKILDISAQVRQTGRQGRGGSEG